MAAYDGKSKRIKNALKQMLANITYDAGSGAEPAFTQVLGAASTEFNSYPSIRVLPGQYQSEKWSIGQNKRVLPFIASVYLELEHQSSEEAVYDKMYDLTDLVFDTLDSGDFSGGLNAIDPTIGTYILRANRGDFLVDTANIGAVLYCDMNVEVEYTKDL